MASSLKRRYLNYPKVSPFKGIDTIWNISGKKDCVKQKEVIASFE